MRRSLCTRTRRSRASPRQSVACYPCQSWADYTTNISECEFPTGTGILARLYDRAGRAHDAQGIPCAIRPDRRAGENAVPSPPSHVEARLRLRAGQCRPRHQGAAGLARPQEHPAHRPIHRAFTRQVPRLLARLDWRPSRAPRVGTGAVRRISNELGCACGRCDPPVGGTLEF